jgi:hypothetical protein
VRSTQYNPNAEHLRQAGIRLINIHVPEPNWEPEQEQTFTRRQKRLYEQATGQQRTEAKSRITKRKASTVGKEVKARSKNSATRRTGKGISKRLL